jgi:hypothetical protein
MKKQTNSKKTKQTEKEIQGMLDKKAAGSNRTQGCILLIWRSVLLV